MFGNVCKRQRLCPKTNTNLDANKDDTKKDITHKVMYCNDYMQLISSYLSIPEFFASLPLLSTYHTDFAKDPKQVNNLKMLVSYDFGEIWTIYNVNLTTKSVCQLYNDWNYFIMLGKQKNFLPNDPDDTTAHLGILMCLNKSQCIKYWLHKV